MLPSSSLAPLKIEGTLLAERVTALSVKQLIRARPMWFATLVFNPLLRLMAFTNLEMQSLMDVLCNLDDTRRKKEYLCQQPRVVICWFRINKTALPVRGETIMLVPPDRTPELTKIQLRVSFFNHQNPHSYSVRKVLLCSFPLRRPIKNKTKGIHCLRSFAFTPLLLLLLRNLWRDFPLLLRTLLQ